MIPYNIDYCEEKIKEYKEKIKELNCKMKLN